MSGIRPGDVIAGKFQVERVLGEGGMGYVVAARHLQLGQMVALKFMRDEVCTPDYKSRFLREARNTVRLKSKHVSRVLDVGALEGGAPYMVMEYLEGRDLSDLLHKVGPVPVQEACEYILQACEAIAEAHGHGIVHRDLKPANLFLTKGQSGEPVVKVLDFGVSKVLDLGMDDDTNPGGRRRERPDSVVTKASDLLGSPSYMAPEQIVSAADADARSDIWSLGVILFRLISGKAPFHANSLGELIQQIMHGPIPNLRDAKPDVPQGLEHIVARCLERDRAARLGDVVELARMLAPYATPVTTPSLERIAILGPALVARPSAPPPAPSGPSFNSISPINQPINSRSSVRSVNSVSSHGNAWTTPPMHPMTPIEPEKKELTPASALIWGVIFVGFVAVTAIVVARVARRNELPIRPVAAMSSDTPSDPANPANPVTVSAGNPGATTLPGAGFAPPAPLPPNLDPANGTVVAAGSTPGLAPSPKPSAHAPVSAGGIHVGRPAPKPGRPGDPPPKPGPEIPPTRD